MSQFNFDRIEKTFNERKRMEEEIVGLNARIRYSEMNALAYSSDADPSVENNAETAAMHQRTADTDTVRKTVLENKLKTMTGCNISADVSYSSAVRFYKQYRIKIGKIKSDTCKTCESLCLKISRSNGARKAAYQEEYDAHLKMADEGYKCKRSRSSCCMCLVVFASLI